MFFFGTVYAVGAFVDELGLAVAGGDEAFFIYSFFYEIVYDGLSTGLREFEVVCITAARVSV